jgi:AraC family transcriptional regulator, regulatory protein of adaptative response / methylated-DNA-[protein]-cysteine methyltransferase
MLIDLPDHAALYRALVARDVAFDGRVYVGVASTGVFCRLTCPARKPKAENCEFFGSVAECVEAGYRPCLRCHPVAPSANSDPAVKVLLAELRERNGHRWTESDITALGFDPSTVRRAFRRQFGMTFLEMARMDRIRSGLGTLANGGRVIDAQLEAGFDSPSAFRSAMAKLLGQPPSAFKNGGLLRIDWLETPLGPMVVVADKQAIHLFEFVDRKALPRELKALYARCKGSIGLGRSPAIDLLERELTEYFHGRCAEFSVPLALHGSEFAKSVWQRLRTIPVGKTRSYSDVARDIGRPSAIRAVARANGANRIAIVVPCHRVIGTDGSLTGYGGGLWRKQKLIEIERQFPQPAR